MISKRISEAVIFATTAHDGSYRKDSDIPYISHPMEAGLIAMSITDDEDVIIATFLHDVVEDTDYEIEDIREHFGDRVAMLVDHESEDKMRHMPSEESWKLRKQAFVDSLKTAPIEAKIVCLADKISNLRLSEITYLKKGDDMWLAFNQKDKREHEWYYRSIFENLKELSDTEAAKEYAEIFQKIFGKPL